MEGGVVHGWPGWPLKDTIEVVAAVLGVFVGVAAVILSIVTLKFAGRQEEISREQTRISKEQTDIALRQEALDKEQAAIARRQAEIAERQHEIEMAQIGRAAKLRIRVRQQTHRENRYTLLAFEMVNEGSKSTEGFYWDLMVPRQLSYLAYFIDERGYRAKFELFPVTDTEVYEQVSRNDSTKLYPTSSAKMIELKVESADTGARELYLLARALGDDGATPSSGFDMLKLVRKNNGWSYEVSMEPYELPETSVDNA